MTTVEVVEYTDPWCSWAWGTEPKLRRLRWRYGDRLTWRTVMGDLVANRAAGIVGYDPARAAPKTAAYWEKVHRHTGMPWPVGLRWPPVESAATALAIKAAQRQGDDVGAALVRAVRESCFVHGAPADTAERVAALAATIDGLNVARMEAEVDSDEVMAAFLADGDETRRPNRYVLELDETHEGKGNAKPDGEGWRYVFPTLLFRGPGGEHTVPGWQPWEAYVAAMEAAAPGSSEGGRPDPTPDEAMATWWLFTERELTFLCGAGATPPTGVDVVDWGAGQAYARPGAPAPRDY